MITEIFPALRGARMLIVCDAPTPAPEQKSEETTVMPESEPKAETSVVEVPTKPHPKPVVEITEPVVKLGREDQRGVSGRHGRQSRRGVQLRRPLLG